MTIYLDYIFFENVIINLVIVIVISACLREKIKKVNSIVGVIFISLYTTIIYLLENTFVSSMYIKIIVVIINVYITFRPKTLIEFSKKIVYYSICNFMYVGIIISITLFFNINLEKIYLKILIYIISGIILYFFTKFMWKLWKSNIKNDDLEYIININGKKIIGFVDTGNNVKEKVTNLDVIFIDASWYLELKEYLKKCEKVKLNINTINNSSDEYGYILKNILIYKNKKEIANIEKIVICFVEKSLSNKKYSALIGYNTYVDKLKGVTFC